jgi:uncharacterized cupin superfamily protein
MIRVTTLSDLPHRQLTSSAKGETYALSAELAGDFAIEGTFLHHDVIAPGTRAARSHWHSHQKEIVVLLEGELIVKLGASSQRLVAGQAVSFLPGGPTPHTLCNEGATAARVLVIASNTPEDVVHYSE